MRHDMDEIKWKPGGEKHVLQTYASLHKHKLFGEHWAWVALERMAAGENEAEVMRDYGYALVPPGWQVVPREPTEEMEGAGWDVEELRTPDRIYVAMLNAAPEAATMGPNVGIQRPGTGPLE